MELPNKITEGTTHHLNGLTDKKILPRNKYVFAIARLFKCSNDL